MKGEKASLWEKAPAPKGLKEGGNELLEGAAGGGISMPVGSGKDPGSAKLPYTKMEPTIKDDTAAPGAAESKSAKKNAYAGEMGTDGEKLSPMAQKVGSPRKGY